MMNPETFRACTGASLALTRLHFSYACSAMEEFVIDSKIRQAAFLAQVGHETEGLIYTKEIWGPTDAQKRYEPPSTLATRLGNTKPGDGKRYMGRGPIQITGRFNYRKFGARLGMPLEDFPQLLEERGAGWRAAGAFWEMNGCNELADAGDFVALTKRINGGKNGLADRQRRWALATTALGVA